MWLRPFLCSPYARYLCLSLTKLVVESRNCHQRALQIFSQISNQCNIVKNDDDIFSMQIAYSFTGSILVAWLMIYIVIYDGFTFERGALIFFMQCFWAVAAAIVKVAVDCVSGAIVDGTVRLGVIAIVKGIYRWLNARLWYLQSIRNLYITDLHKAFDMNLLRNLGWITIGKNLCPSCKYIE